jgi:hypothetical protein
MVHNHILAGTRLHQKNVTNIIMAPKGTSTELSTRWKRYNFLWVTLILLIGSMIGHWLFGWSAYKQEQEAHQQPVVVKEYVIEMLRDTFENWQSEFLQLIWQVGGLAFLYYLGSPQSKEGDDRKEEKLDEIIRLLDPDNGDKTVSRIDRKWPKK